jgi:hypothetical protein
MKIFLSPSLPAIPPPLSSSSSHPHHHPHRRMSTRKVGGGFMCDSVHKRTYIVPPTGFCLKTSKSSEAPTLGIFAVSSVCKYVCVCTYIRIHGRVLQLWVDQRWRMMRIYAVACAPFERNTYSNRCDSSSVKQNRKRYGASIHTRRERERERERERKRDRYCILSVFNDTESIYRERSGLVISCNVIMPVEMCISVAIDASIITQCV